MDLQENRTNVPNVSETTALEIATAYDGTIQESTNVTSKDFAHYRWSLWIQAAFGVFIVIVGILGNSLVIAVYLSKRKKLSSTNLYLVTLAVADLTVCFIGQLCRAFPRALTGYDTASLSPWVCSSWFFINHSAKTISGWTLVAVTTERTLLVYWPLKGKTITARKYAFIVIPLICVFCSVIYLHYFWSYGRKYETIDGEEVLTAWCSVNAEQGALAYYMSNIRPWQDLLIRSVLPFILLLICNVLIILRLAQQHKNKKEKMKSQDDEANKRKDAQMKSITAMLLTVSFTHLVCISPMQIMYVVDGSDPFGWTITEPWQATVALRWGIAIAVYYLNHAINFLLYVISSSEFRKDLLHLRVKAKQKMVCFNNQVFSLSSGTTSGVEGRSAQTAS